MNHRRNAQLSFQAVSRARARTALSVVGMAIGIAAMVLLLGLGAGAERAFERALEQMGENILAISAGRTESGALRGQSRQVETLLLSDMQAIRQQVEGVLRVAPLALQQMRLRYADETMSTTVIGTTPDYRWINKPLLHSGRFFSEDEVVHLSRVAVIGSAVAKELYAGEEPLGSRLLMNNIPFIVVGVLQEKGTDPTGADQDNRVLIPVLTAQRRTMQAASLDRIFVQATSRERLSVVEASVATLLRQRHKLDEGEEDFTLRSQESLLAALTQVDLSFARLLAGLAIVTLTMVSVGLLATSLLSVRERHAEIGIRMAVGAMPRQVLVQFLSESVMIALIGAAGGLLVGTAGMILGGQLLDWRVALTWQSALLPFLVSLGISVLFGVYPAWRAARLDPILALRSA